MNEQSTLCSNCCDGNPLITIMSIKTFGERVYEEILIASSFMLHGCSLLCEWECFVTMQKQKAVNVKELAGIKIILD